MTDDNGEFWQHVKDTIAATAALTDWGKGLAAAGNKTLTPEQAMKGISVEGQANYAWLMAQTLALLLTQLADAELTKS